MVGTRKDTSSRVELILLVNLCNENRAESASGSGGIDRRVRVPRRSPKKTKNGSEDPALLAAGKLRQAGRHYEEIFFEGRRTSTSVKPWSAVKRGRAMGRGTRRMA
jgi:hypothetical protein